MLQQLIQYHSDTNTLNEVVGLPCTRVKVVTLDYDGNTDADILAIEAFRTTKNIRVIKNCRQDGQKLRAFVFNVKYRSDSLLISNDSSMLTKFSKLCLKLNAEFDVTLCFACASATAEAMDAILGQWNDGLAGTGISVLPHVVTLSKFHQGAPDFVC